MSDGGGPGHPARNPKPHAGSSVRVRGVRFNDRGSKTADIAKNDPRSWSLSLCRTWQSAMTRSAAIVRNAGRWG